FDMSAYEDYLAGKLQNYEYPRALIDDAMKEIPQL
ncbi:hypothetical protein LCGC14_1874650, partial [marine sediment metagenome]